MRITSCFKCDLCLSRTNIVNGEGAPNAKIMFIGDSPTQRDDKLGKPFVGKAGIYLSEILLKFNLSRNQQYYITNICKCRSTSEPKEKEIDACLPYLRDEIREVDPRIIVLLGGTALRAFLGNSALVVAQHRNRWFSFENHNLLVTYHPAYLMQNPEYLPYFMQDMHKVVDMYRSYNPLHQTYL